MSGLEGCGNEKWQPNTQTDALAKIPFNNIIYAGILKDLSEGASATVVLSHVSR